MAVIPGITSIKHDLSGVNISDSTSVLSAGKGRDHETRITNLESGFTGGMIVNVYRNSAQTTGSSEELIIFNTSLRNTGGHYNTTTGIFTAPAVGDYAIRAWVGVSTPASSNYVAAINSYVEGVYNGTLRYGTVVYNGLGSNRSYVESIESLGAGSEIGITLNGTAGVSTLLGRQNVALIIVRMS